LRNSLTLKQKALSGVKWLTLASFLGSGIQFLKISVLTRLLHPAEFGLMAMAMVVVGFSQGFVDMGISNAIIYRQDVNEKQLSTLYWLNHGASLVIAIIVWLASPAVASFYQEPRLKDILFYLAFTFLIQAFGQQHRVLLTKDLYFKQLSVIDLTVQLSDLCVTTLMALNGMGVMSLVIGTVSNSALSTLLLLFIGRKSFQPSLFFCLRDVKDLLKFGAFQMGEKTINFFSANIDKILIAKFLGMQAVGFYSLAWNLMVFPLTKINPIVNRVAYPVYAKLQKDKKALSSYFLLSVHALSLLAIPILCFVFFYSSQIVTLVYGQNWTKTAEIIKVLAFVGILKAVGNPGGSLILAMGRPDIGFWWNVFWTVLLTGTYGLTMYLSDDVTYVACSLLFLTITTSGIWYFILNKLASIDLRLMFGRLIKTFVAVAFIGHLSTYLSSYAKECFPHSELFAGIFVCAVFYAFYVYFAEKNIIEKIRGSM